MDKLPYGFRRVKHGATKNDRSTDWLATLVLVTDWQIDNEVEAERDIESIVLAREIPMFGIVIGLGHIDFNWTPTDSDRASYGEVRCIVTVGYHASIQRLNQDEINRRLAEMKAS